MQTLTEIALEKADRGVFTRQEIGCWSPGSPDRQFIARGRALNRSANGLFVVMTEAVDLPVGGQVLVELSLPEPNAQAGEQTVSYRCRVIRRLQMGHLVGLGVEFLDGVD